MIQSIYHATLEACDPYAALRNGNKHSRPSHLTVATSNEPRPAHNRDDTDHREGASLSFAELTLVKIWAIVFFKIRRQLVPGKTNA